MTIFGLDVSDRQHGLDLTLAKEQGYRFVGARLLSYPGGNTVVADPSWSRFRDRAKALRLGFYAYILPHTGVALAAQWAAARAAIGDHSIPIMVDWEPDGTSEPNLDYVVNFWDGLVHAGLRPRSLYAPKWWWSEQGSRDLRRRPWRLVSSDYGDNRRAVGTVAYQGDGWRGWAPYGGLTPTVCQFGSRVRLDGWGDDLDGDAYRGTLVQLAGTGMVTTWPAPTTGGTVEPADVWNYQIANPLKDPPTSFSAQARLLDVETDLDAVKAEQAAQRELLDRIVAKLDA